MPFQNRICVVIVWSLVLSMPAKAQLCGPDVSHSTKRVKQKSQLETEPPQDKAVVYVLAPTYEAGYTQNKVSANRVWIGVNQYRSYFVVALPPGTHDFCSKSGGNVNHLTISVEAGKSYFLKQDTMVGSGIGRKATILSQITAEDAQVLLKKCKRMVFWEKGMPEPESN
jgi:hypothetical protein